jgi:hypothetical protein
MGNYTNYYISPLGFENLTTALLNTYLAALSL